uniref:Dipeptidylpeptidase IV N-terminal domain-containing protein n=1 Tax=candidate division WOR-3 bacterium TaxID=2052148 RepID=A0A7V3VU12_UNCW3
MTIEDTFPQIGPHDGRMFVLKRDGSNLKEVGRGLYADISPDQKKFVYQKFNQGLWIMNIDGTNSHPVSTDSLDGLPAWSSDGEWIAYVRKEGWNDEDLWIMDTIGNLKMKKRDGTTGTQPDWAPVDTNALVWVYIIVYLSDNTTRGISGAYLKWSPDGSHFVGYDPSRSIYVMRVDGSNKFYIEP